ncbi:MAG: alkaline phosphatase [Deltaproteobacteria bacterium RIFCSPLOWO2_02_FULL_50_16]|nr:MAG: alkaline phosphatase [Deltaproteobacteria bacterium GWA2_50_8]OGQ57227.1 MAG: alkaline phosphatase [Deltaproteobacteria bacterium RIFCSPLOWO2_02_FULL_50_16]OGQ67215.1 MAG: alkaline phosphatase [Deltaproteobacteria bacterium RIFCSPLOWO2_12_FULL_50_11]
MFANLLGMVASFITLSISTLGLWGIGVMMAIESACIPLPSEIIMPFSGYLVSQGRFTLWETAVAGALGCVVGSALAYAIGRYGGRSFIWRYGRYVLISHHDIELADRWFAHYGQGAIFLSRLLPVVRTFISLPAGIAKMRFDLFLVWTFLGSLPWCYALSYIGLKMGEHWETLGAYFHRFDAAIGIILLIGLFWWIRRHLRHIKTPSDRS